MPKVNVSIIEFVEESQPNFVKARLTDALHNDWFFIDKCVIFTAVDLNDESSYPLTGSITCKVIKQERDSQGREILTIDTEEPWHVEDISGETRFIVFAHQLTDTDNTADTHAH